MLKTATTSNPFDSRTILDGIRRWVEIETPTEAPEQVNKLATMVAEGYRDLPATIERVAGHFGCGDHILARSSWGYLAYHAFAQLCATPERSPLGVTQLYVSDEEIGSPTSRALIEAEGRKAKYVLVTEPARDGGKIVTGRKGVARFEILVKGVPAHAGTRPEDGRSAIRELANIIQALEAMNDLKRGVTVNVGVVRGGTRPNVIAEEAYAEVDLRVPSIADGDDLVPRILNLKSRTEGVSVKVVGGLNRPPYEKGNAGAALYEHARELAAEIGFDLVDTSTGGGSDGNFTAPHTATLDGLGVDGQGAHTHYEQLYISSIEPRARLLHRLYQMLR